jgi:hypothetical protein
MRSESLIRISIPNHWKGHKRYRYFLFSHYNMNGTAPARAASHPQWAWRQSSPGPRQRGAANRWTGSQGCSPPTHSAGSCLRLCHDFQGGKLFFLIIKIGELPTVGQDHRDAARLHSAGSCQRQDFKGGKTFLKNNQKQNSSHSTHKKIFVFGEYLFLNWKKTGLRNHIFKMRIRIRIKVKSWLRIRVKWKAGSGSGFALKWCGSQIFFPLE